MFVFFAHTYLFENGNGTTCHNSGFPVQGQVWGTLHRSLCALRTVCRVSRVHVPCASRDATSSLGKRFFFLFFVCLFSCFFPHLFPEMLGVFCSNKVLRTWYATILVYVYVYYMNLIGTLPSLCGNRLRNSIIHALAPFLTSACAVCNARCLFSFEQKAFRLVQIRTACAQLWICVRGFEPR